jgi:light-independent protochlorophyllide reductase subunit B
MEDHLLEIFNGHDTKEVLPGSNQLASGNTISHDSSFQWSPDALEELSRIPGFVRGKVKRNVEKFATQKNQTCITLDLMFAAKEAVNA